jgi:hypothetical protein
MCVCGASQTKGYPAIIAGCINLLALYDCCHVDANITTLIDSRRIPVSSKILGTFIPGQSRLATGMSDRLAH